jgi:hypothetical protein
MPAAQKLKILFLAANPVNTTQLRLDEELRDIKIALQLAQQRDRFELQAVAAARIDDMRRAMLSFEPQVVHFSGHGENGSIYLEDKNGNARAIAGDALGKFFANFPSVQCVVLNACYSEELGGAITKTVPYVVGMQTAVEDTAAISFAVAFYDVLGAGGTYERAFSLAANTLELEGTLQAADPVLVQKVESGGDGKPAQPVAAVPAGPLAPAAFSITRLSGAQFKQFHEALLSAFDKSTLGQMVQFELGVNINAVAGGDNMSAVAFNLIDWAQRTGRLGDLIAAADKSSGGNPEVKAFVASL